MYSPSSPMIQIEAGYTKWLDYKGMDELEARASELEGRSYPHLESLAGILRAQQTVHGPLSDVLDSKLDALAKGEAFTIVTGQQVGVFGGPLFAVYKLLTVLKRAKQAEAVLGKPVIPIFWMATEDHDFAEINHVYAPQPLSRQLRKEALSTVPLAGKASVGELEFDRLKIELVQMLQRLFVSETETVHTATLYHELVVLLQASHSFAQFFGKMMRRFVGNDFLLFDPHQPDVRRLEREAFKQLIVQHDRLHEVFRDSFEDGMPTVELNRDAAHVFYHDGTRELLTKERDVFTTKRGHRFTEAELLQEIDEHPERFSNNVVSRPLMQDYLFPTLAYVAGPGEIAYWLQLRPLFHVFGWKMPLLIPRLGAVVMSTNDEKKLAQEGTTLVDYLTNPLPDHSFDDESFDQSLYAYRTLSEAIGHEAGKRGHRFETNARHILDRLADEMRAEAKREQYRLNRRRIHLSTRLLPMDAPQERIWSMVPLMNRHGDDLFVRLRAAYEQAEWERCLVKI
ncbi:bacillithiol biosynthesis cysteine-adding enzyme BshC [Exiguobacterium aurantiacum]|uniref:bacillithiol biosynthesis cysteine-adding enzyme BshC n=1 Tax=Exiguobacterium aurantiacum TaxID=33987 RepID=UPI0020B759E8|nr:bacillithiol biosynthesis cysteine-adding enzyme BshC [Exiguobacterium aurantiacum]